MKLIFTISITLFVFTLFLRLWNLHSMGRTWDEQSLIEKGYNFAQLFTEQSFTHPYWYKGPDHPPLANYFYALVAHYDFLYFDEEAKSIYPGLTGAPVFRYDFNAARLMSVFISSLTVFFVFLLGYRFFSLFVGVAAGLIFAMLPHFLGYSQLVTYESAIMFSFTGAAFSYFFYFQTRSRRWLILSGVFTGLTLLAKQSNIFIFVLLIGMYLLQAVTFEKNKLSLNVSPNFLSVIVIGIIAIATFFLLWPMPFFHMSEVLQFTRNMWLGSGLVPELLFGIRMGAPFFFYIIAFFITTPLLILLPTLYGIIVSTMKKKWFYYALILWFITPFLLSIIAHKQQTVRYIIQFYAPLSLLAAIGIEVVLKKLKINPFHYYLALIPIFLYLFSILYNISPYYFNYYNELVGGTGNVYTNKLFFLGQWGEGTKNPALFLEANAKTGDTIGLALNPDHVLYRSEKFNYETFDPTKEYDFILVNYYMVIRNEFDESQLEEDYDIAYTEKASSADLVHVWKRKD